MKALITLVAVLALITGCTNGKFDPLATLETGVHMKLLDAEFDQVVDAVEALPLNDYEASEMGAVIAELQLEREVLRTMHKQNAGRIALSAVKSQATLDSMTEAVTAGRDTYLAYIDRTDQSVDPLLKSYYESAVIARENIQSAIDSGGGVSAVQLTQYLGLALRTIAAVNGVPL